MPLRRWQLIFMFFLIVLDYRVFAQIPADKSLIDFDSVVYLDPPQLVTIYRSSDPQQHIYFLIPSSLGIERDEAGKPRLGLYHHGIRKRDKSKTSGGQLVITFRPTYGALNIQDIITLVRKIDPGAKFAFPIPTQSQLRFFMDNHYGSEVLIDTISPQASGLNSSVATVTRLTDLGLRAFLDPGSDTSQLFLARYQFTLRGIERDTSMNVTMTTRTFSVGLSFPSMCHKYPELFVDLTTGQTGCLLKKPKKPWWKF